jgi:hypothetical protein
VEEAELQEEEEEVVVVEEEAFARMALFLWKFDNGAADLPREKSYVLENFLSAVPHDEKQDED